MARIESGTLTLNCADVNLVRMINDAWESLAAAADANGIQSSVHLDPAVLASLFYLDPTPLTSAGIPQTSR